MSTVRRLSRARCAQSGAAVLGLSLALSSALPSIPAAAAAGAVQVVSSSSFTEDGGVFVAGQLVNRTGHAIARPGMSLLLLDSRNKSLGSVGTGAQTGTLDDGEFSGFSIAFQAPEGYDHLRIGTLSNDQSAQPANRNFAITVTDHYTLGDHGLHHVVGTIKNLNTGRASLVSVDATYFDKSGKAIGAEQDFPSPDDGSNALAAGETADFDVVYQGQTGAAAPASFVVVANSPDDPSPMPTSWVSVGGGGALAYGEGAEITGTVTKRGTDNAPRTASVELLARVAGASDWKVVSTSKTNSEGKVLFRPKPERNTSYVIRLPATATQKGSQSPSQAVVVNALNTAKLSAASTKLGLSATLTATVAPGQAGRTVTLQRLVSGKWTNVTSHALSSKSAWVFSVKPTARGTYTYRTSTAAYAANGAGASAPVALKVT